MYCHTCFFAEVALQKLLAFVIEKRKLHCKNFLHLSVKKRQCFHIQCNRKCDVWSSNDSVSFEYPFIKVKG